MRILIVNSYEFPANFLADSSYTLTRRLIESMKDVFFLWPIPELDLPTRRKYSATVKPVFPDNCLPIPMPMYSGRALSEMLVSEQLYELINPTFGSRTDYDLILTNNAGCANVLSSWMQYFHGGERRPPIIIHDYNTTFAGSDCDVKYVANSFERVVQHYTGYLLADAIVFFTKWTQDKAVKQMKIISSPASAVRFMKKISTVPAIFKASMVDHVLSVNKVRKRPNITVYWGGRLTSTKRVALAAEVADYLYSFGRNVGMLLTIPTKGFDRSKLEVGKCRKYPTQFEVYEGLSQEEAIMKMASCHLSIFPQSLRFGPAAPLEQIRAGLIVLINRKDSLSVLPESYPWYFSSKDELNVLIRRVIANYPKEMEKQEYWRQYVYDNLSIETQLSALKTILYTAIEGNRKHFSKSTSLLSSGRTEDVHPGDTWTTFRDRLVVEHSMFRMMDRSPTFRGPGGGNPALWPVYQCLRTQYKGNHILPDPIMRREDELTIISPDGRK